MLCQSKTTDNFSSKHYINSHITYEINLDRMTNQTKAQFSSSMIIVGVYLWTKSKSLYVIM